MKKLVLAVIALGFSVGVNAACDTKSLKGSYVINTTFTGLQNNSYPITCGQIGIINFDGKGGTTLNHVSGCAGILPNEGSFATETGRYSFDNLCSGTAIFSKGDPEEEITLIFIFDNNLTKASFVFNGINTISGSGSIFKQ